MAGPEPPTPERTCCLWCPDWPVVVVRRRDPAFAEAPIAVVERGEGGQVVRAASEAARDEGVVPGLRKREAEARCAGLVVVDADDAADARAFEAVVRAVEQLSPRLVLEHPGRLTLPTRGPARYFGGDDAFAARVLAVVRDVGAHARVGIADGGFAAGLAARAADDGDARVVPVGETPAFLAPWPVGVLAPCVDDGDRLVDLLSRLGLRTLGGFAALPAAAVLTRFGPAGARAHRLAAGLAEHEAPAVAPPPDLVETVELDPPAGRVEEVLFPAKALADRLLRRLDELGLCCTSVSVEAETEHGERLERCWRHEGGLTPAALVTRVRWQLEGWLTAQLGADDAGDSEGEAAVHGLTGGLALLRLRPEGVMPAAGRQLGFWGGDPAAADRAARVLTRVQGMLGHEAVVTAVAVGGRTPTEQVRWVPWGERREASATAPAPWPGAIPGPAPARVFDPPLPAELLDAAGHPVVVSGRGEPSAAPAVLRCPALPGGGGVLVGWAGPWAHDLRWWDQSSRRRRALWQVVATGVACLVATEGGEARLEAIYD